MAVPNPNNFLASFWKNPTELRFESQQTGEKPILLLRQHPVTQIVPTIFIGILALLPIGIGLGIRAFNLDWLLTAVSNLQVVLILATWYLIVYGLALERFLLWYFNVYILTNERIIDVDFMGIAFKRVSECRLSQVQDVTFAVSGSLGTFFHYGDIFIQTAAERPEFEFRSVPRPDWVANEISLQIRLEEAEAPGVVA